jgi:predicted porin
LGGELSDKVAWELTSMWTSEPEILTAKIDLKLIPMTTLTVGRFIPDQGKAFQYHILSRVHTIYLPMAAMTPNYGAPENTGAFLVPFFQTGAQASIGNKTAHVSLGYFNGLEPQLIQLPGDTSGDPSTPNMAGANNFMEMDNSKAFLAKGAVNASGFEVGIHWWDEYANVRHYRPVKEGTTRNLWATDDAHINIYGGYVGYNHEKFHILAEYLENNIDFLDTGSDNLQQNDWYAQLGVSPVNAFELVFRYEAMDGKDLKRDSFSNDEETWITLGANYYILNKNAAIAVQHIWKDHDDLEWNDNEFNFLVEVDL